MDAFCQVVEAYIERCCQSKSAARVAELAELLGISRVTLNFRVKKHYGVSALQFLRAQQVARSVNILQMSELPTTAVGYRAGFGTRRTFYRSFRRVTGTTPANVRRRR
jgi:AraC-like DNA-binding protein